MKSETLTKFVKTLDSQELQELLDLCQKETADRLLSTVNFLQFLFEPPDDRSAGTLRFSVKTKYDETFSVEATITNGECEDVNATLGGLIISGLGEFEVPTFFENTSVLEAKKLCVQAFLDFEKTR